ncbi:hypothetical protein ABFA07_015580 [Porites harrisoni]
MSLLNISRHDAGKYNCTAWKKQEFASDEFNLHVNSAPNIASLPDKVIVLESEEQLITCQADGWPRPNMAWKHKDSYLGNDTRYEIRRNLTLNQLTLVIKFDDDLDVAYYTCEASNAFGISSSNVMVTFQENDDFEPEDSSGEMLVRSPSEMLPESPHVIANKGNNVTLTCKAININDPETATIWWTFNGKLLNSDKSRFTKESTTNWTLMLDIYNVSKQDAGQYQCGISDWSGRAPYMNTITLIVEGKDGLQNISANWKTVKAAAGTSAQLMCQAFHSTFIDANTFWLFQGVMLNDSLDARFKIGEFRWKSSNVSQTVEMKIEINNLSVSDFGSYSCVINTTTGVSSKLVFLEVQNEEREGGKENSTMFIIIFPLTAGGLLLALSGLIILRRMQKKRRDLKLQEKAAAGEFTYDVFVTFSSKDRQWVSTKLTPLLESHRLKYCIHSRDFELGRALVDNMAESVYSSRKVLAVLSKNYLESKFCRGELEMALYRSKVGRDGSLLVVTIDGIKKNKLPKALRESTFVDYHSDTGRSSWEKKLLRLLVQEDNNQNVFNTKL